MNDDIEGSQPEIFPNGLEHEYEICFHSITTQISGFTCYNLCVCVSHQSCLTLCDPMDCSLPGSYVHGILQARILEWVAFPSPGDLPDPGIDPASLMSPVLAISPGP